MFWFKIYLITCIPALVFIMWTVWEDIQCLHGKKKPCHKFGYNWARPWNQRFTPLFVLLQLVPVLNLYTGWFITMGIIVTSIVDWFKK